jgi:hypothetical protein
MVSSRGTWLISLLSLTLVFVLVWGNTPPIRPGNSFECNLRRVALAHAARIVTNETQLNAVKTALRIGEYCGPTPPIKPRYTRVTGFRLQREGKG